ncbi:MAG: ABC transporter ATP-binding protein [Planctomycetota bacterium]|jgi:ABC-type multidrug transport system ATPase subunit
MELKINNISKTYPGGVRALRGVTLTIPTGMFGLLGPNGSGKSTLMRMIATLQEPDEGAIHLGPIDVLNDKAAVRRGLGYMPQEFGLYPNVSALTLLTHFATLKGITDAADRRPAVEALLRRTNLWDARKKKLGGFSGGMKRRFGIAQALLGNPQLIIVDEPTAGLDPEERNRFLNLLSEIGENVVVILSTHIVDDVAGVCTNMAIIRQGCVLRTDQPQVAIDEMKGKTWKKTIVKDQLVEHQERFEVISVRLNGGRIVIHVYSEQAPDPSFTEVSPDLQDVYFRTLSRLSPRGEVNVRQCVSV